MSAQIIVLDARRRALAPEPTAPSPWEELAVASVAFALFAFGLALCAWSMWLAGEAATTKLAAPRGAGSVSAGASRVVLMDDARPFAASPLRRSPQVVLGDSTLFPL